MKTESEYIILSAKRWYGSHAVGSVLVAKQGYVILHGTRTEVRKLKASLEKNRNEEIQND